ncbi:MAG: hypothetical protein AB7I48_11940 [Planctomycetaceae bacterium]
MSSSRPVQRLPLPPRTSRRRLLWGLLSLPMVAGCAQMAVVGRVFYGDPKHDGIFEQITGSALDKGARVALVCTAPDSISTEYDMVSLDIQKELIRMMRKKGIDVIESAKVSTALDDNGGYFDLRAIVDAVDVDYLFHVDVEQFSHLAPNSPQLYHGRATGYVYGYKIEGENEQAAGKHAVHVFEREFNSEYPGKHPVPADRTPERVFRNRFIQHLCSELGRMFYEFRTNETF